MSWLKQKDYSYLDEDEIRKYLKQDRYISFHLFLPVRFRMVKYTKAGKCNAGIWKMEQLVERSSVKI